MAFVLTMYFIMSFVLTGFGVWPMWSMVIGVIAGFVYMIFTYKRG
jgi:hypothetical protein